MLKSLDVDLVKSLHGIRECRWQGGFCSRSCSWLDLYGVVQICSEHGNPRGRLTRRKRVFN